MTALASPPSMPPNSPVAAIELQQLRSEMEAQASERKERSGLSTPDQWVLSPSVDSPDSAGIGYSLSLEPVNGEDSSQDYSSPLVGTGSAFARFGAVTADQATQVDDGPHTEDGLTRSLQSTVDLALAYMKQLDSSSSPAFAAPDSAPVIAALRTIAAFVAERAASAATPSRPSRLGLDVSDEALSSRVSSREEAEAARRPAKKPSRKRKAAPPALEVGLASSGPEDVVPEEFVLSDAITATTETQTPGNGRFLSTPRFKLAPSNPSLISPTTTSAAEYLGSDADEPDVSDAVYEAMHQPAEAREKELHARTVGSMGVAGGRKLMKQRKALTLKAASMRSPAAPARSLKPSTAAGPADAPLRQSIAAAGGGADPGRFQWEVVPRAAGAVLPKAAAMGRGRNCIVLKKRRRKSDKVVQDPTVQHHKMARAQAFKAALASRQINGQAPS